MLDDWWTLRIRTAGDAPLLWHFLCGPVAGQVHTTTAQTHDMLLSDHADGDARVCLRRDRCYVADTSPHTIPDPESYANSYDHACARTHIQIHSCLLAHHNANRNSHAHAN